MRDAGFTVRLLIDTGGLDMKRATKIGIAVAGATAAAAAGLRMSKRADEEPREAGPTVAPVVEPGVNGDAFLEHLGAAIRIDTTSHDDRSKIDTDRLLEFHQFLEDTYPLVHESCTKEVINDYSLLYTWPGTDPESDPLVLMAHIDVVPVEGGTEDDWTEPPFSGVIAHDHMWGRGALDDKGPLIATIEAIEHLMRSGFEPTRTILMTFGHDEEIGGQQGASVVAEAVRDRGITPWFVIDEGGLVADEIPTLSADPVALVKVAEKGYVDVKLTSRAEGGHSSVPPESTAVGSMGRAVHRIEQNPMRPRVGVLTDMFAALAPRMDRKTRSVLTNLKVSAPVVAKLMSSDPFTAALIRTTSAVTMVSGGHKANVLPQEATAIVNYRIIPGDTVDDVISHVSDVVGPDIEVEIADGFQASDPSRFSSSESEAWYIVKTAVEETFPEAITAPWILTGATDSKYYNSFAGDVYGFAPFTIPAEGAGFHDTNERIRTADAERAVSFYCRLIRLAQPTI
jgi:carboxypeptidase PM20D1